MKHPITLRIDPELLVQAKSVARKENRTLTNFIETLLIQHLATGAARMKSQGHDRASPAVPESKIERPKGSAE